MASTASKVVPIKEPPTGLALLRAPFPDHQISKLPKPFQKDAPKGKCLPKSKGGAAPDFQDHFCGGYHGLPAVHLDYVGHAALTDRLLDTDPAYVCEPMSYGPDGLPAFDKNGGLWVRLTVLGVTRMGYGDAQGKSGPNAVKEAIGDAMRNAAMRFGAALDLWHKGDLHVEDAQDEPTPQVEIPQTGEPSPNYKGWREPESRFSTPSKLRAIMASLDHDLNGCGDSDMVYCVTAEPDWIEFVRIAEMHAPHYLRGGEPAPPEFEGLIVKAERLVREFDTAQANHITDLARA